MVKYRVVSVAVSFFLSVAAAFSQVEFSWDAGCASLGYRSPDKLLLELEVLPLTLIGTSVPFFLEFSPFQVAGVPANQQERFQLEVEGVSFLNLTAGYAFIFGRRFMLVPAFQLNYLDPRDIARVSFGPQLQFSFVYNMDGLPLIPYLQQRLISLSVGVNFSNKDNFAPQAQVMVGLNILAFANLFSESESGGTAR